MTAKITGVTVAPKLGDCGCKISGIRVKDSGLQGGVLGADGCITEAPLSDSIQGQMSFH